MSANVWNQVQRRKPLSRFHRHRQRGAYYLPFHNHFCALSDVIVTGATPGAELKLREGAHHRGQQRAPLVERQPQVFEPLFPTARHRLVNPCICGLSPDSILTERITRLTLTKTRSQSHVRAATQAAAGGWDTNQDPYVTPFPLCVFVTACAQPSLYVFL